VVFESDSMKTSSSHAAEPANEGVRPIVIVFVVAICLACAGVVSFRAFKKPVERVRPPVVDETRDVAPKDSRSDEIRRANGRNLLGNRPITVPTPTKASDTERSGLADASRLESGTRLPDGALASSPQVLPSQRSAAPPTPVVKVVIPAGFNIISGVATLRGNPPAEKVLPLDPACARLAKFQPKTTRFFRRGPLGELADVLVTLQSVPALGHGPPPKPFVISIRECEFEPYISAIRTKQKLLIRNLDSMLDNVHVTPNRPGNQESNKALHGGADLEFSFDNPEVFVRIKDDVHPWMFAYVAVVDHPYFAVTDRNGRFQLPPLPHGQYVVEAHHRKAGKLSQQITVTDAQVPRVDFVFDIPPEEAGN